ncbi:Aste57867_8446 [Aphanomyces stellatus]|uniref:Aste57867_8446 protein n=1 Tax=Aphanomyces stellatus TaxID=120398 RepID=A0A485KKC2_9STRA|nr:hypothetical protein As57867_008414 [Aphanomyces stellatus]VFT85332.1 Aste57867_8446 [Aphanomyces stellatus]
MQDETKTHTSSSFHSLTHVEAAVTPETPNAIIKKTERKMGIILALILTLGIGGLLVWRYGINPPVDYQYTEAPPSFNVTACQVCSLQLNQSSIPPWWHVQAIRQAAVVPNMKSGAGNEAITADAPRPRLKQASAFAPSLMTLVIRSI